MRANQKPRQLMNKDKNWNHCNNIILYYCTFH